MKLLLTAILQLLIFAGATSASCFQQTVRLNYPTTQRGAFVPRNSQWSTAPPAVVDQPGYSSAFSPTGFPEVKNQSLDDVSMSPDEWGISSQQELPRKDIPSEFVQRFPAEELRIGPGRYPSSVVERGEAATGDAQRFSPATSSTRREFSGQVPEIPSQAKTDDNSFALPDTNLSPPQRLDLPGDYSGPPAIQESVELPISPPPMPPAGSQLDSQSIPQQSLPPNLGTMERYPVDDKAWMQGLNSVPAPMGNTDLGPGQTIPPNIPQTQNPGFGAGGWPNSQQFIVPQQSLPQSMMPPRNYRPDLGQRNPGSTFRPMGQLDNGEKFDFEDKKKEYPPFREILATGKYFFSMDANLFKPYFQNNNSIATTSGAVTNSGTFDYGYYLAPSFRAGFESQYGPGLELTYLQFDQASRPSTFFSNGLTTGRIRAVLPEGGAFSELAAVNAGETLTAESGLDVQLIGVSFFKEIKFPISRLNGIFGVQQASVQQQMRADLSNAGGSLGTLLSQSDMKAFGPRVAFEYFRPIGHTKLTLVTKFGGALLFGNRDHFVSNSLTGVSSRIGSDELITKFDFGTAVMWKKFFGENRFFYAKAGYDFQSWMGGGNSTDPQSDFGFRGATLTIGINR